MTDADAFLRTVGKRVRLARLIRELTQAELADAAGISRSFVSLIEHGARGVDVVRLFRLAAALDVPLADLLSDEGPSPRPLAELDRPPSAADLKDVCQVARRSRRHHRTKGAP